MYKKYRALNHEVDEVLETISDSLARTGNVERIVSVNLTDSGVWHIIVEVI